MNKRTFLFLISLSLLFPFHTAQAQDPSPASGPVYVIQPGDSLSFIASRFGVTLADLLAANNITDANTISAGDKVIIPGLEGVSGVLVTEVMNYGDTLESLSRRNQIPEDFLRKLNHITSPSELYAGVGVIFPQKENFIPLPHRLSLKQGDTLLEAAIREGINPWQFQQLNQLPGSWLALPGEALYSPTPNGENATEANGMPSAFANLTVSPLPLTQGGVATLNIQAAPGVQLSGMLVDKPLHFFTKEDGRQVALQGVHAMLEPGAYPLQLTATLPDGSAQTYEQMILIQTGYYPDEILLVEPETIDPVKDEEERNFIASLTAPINPTRYWEGIFQSPGYFPDCYNSRFGNRRTYIAKDEGTKYYSFHTGVDFCGGEGLPITAPADGVIIFSEMLPIRGNATIIDHGNGIYSGFWHQSEIKVQVGQTVSKGEIIGLVGNTGRSTGAHMHWEVWVSGVQVNPILWLSNNYSG